MTIEAKPDIGELVSLVGNIAQIDGDYDTPIAALKLRRCSSTTDPMPCIYGLGLALIVQGGKRITLGDEVFDYGVGQSLITTVDMPVVAYVTRASAAEPFLGIWLELDARLIAQMAAEMEFAAPLQASTARGVSLVALEPGLQDALTRLLRLLAEPSLIPLLAPLIQQEIVVRLLHGGHGSNLRRLVAIGSPSQQIAKVVTWLKQHYTESVLIDDLAAKAHMSPSTFRQHFRAVVGVSPLQYLKNLRLLDARQLMLNENLDAGSAATRVGYESASQFSREYSRLFGDPPNRDIKRMRESSWARDGQSH
ncbi:AraC family transcriptional regulator [Microvirgula aerodenitrificans]|uniref:AraC family transcriptional regulator n=1 Tax=Microvirgula aerodenitrificans TaxID=57480 RepID=A0A2U3TH75_9NEIS|nr:AraC family transcriptional regulator [Microvirgula aerodenitrificans]AVY92756.1 AraC family transcriptional regulator [Microvirgula aerodenitrificans]